MGTTPKNIEGIVKAFVLPGMRAASHKASRDSGFISSQAEAFMSLTEVMVSMIFDAKGFMDAK